MIKTSGLVAFVVLLIAMILFLDRPIKRAQNALNDAIDCAQKSQSFLAHLKHLDANRIRGDSSFRTVEFYLLHRRSENA